MVRSAQSGGTPPWIFLVPSEWLVRLPVTEKRERANPRPLPFEVCRSVPAIGGVSYSSPPHGMELTPSSRRESTGFAVDFRRSAGRHAPSTGPSRPLSSPRRPAGAGRSAAPSPRPPPAQVQGNGLYRRAPGTLAPWRRPGGRPGGGPQGPGLGGAVHGGNPPPVGLSRNKARGAGLVPEGLHRGMKVGDDGVPKDSCVLRAPPHPGSGCGPRRPRDPQPFRSVPGPGLPPRSRTRGEGSQACGPGAASPFSSPNRGGVRHPMTGMADNGTLLAEIRKLADRPGFHRGFFLCTRPRRC